jgi:hypothetical protein
LKGALWLLFFCCCYCADRAFSMKPNKKKIFVFFSPLNDIFNDDTKRVVSFVKCETCDQFQVMKFKRRGKVQHQNFFAFDDSIWMKTKRKRLSKKEEKKVSSQKFQPPNPVKSENFRCFSSAPGVA